MSERKYKAGFYRARGVAGSEQYGTASGGGEQISLDVDVQYEGRAVRLTTILSFNGGALPISIERLKAMGWDGSNELRGVDRQEFDVEIKYEIPPGKNEEKMVVEVKTGQRFKFKEPMSDQQKRGFMSNLSKTAQQLEQANGQPRPQQQQGDMSGANFPFGQNQQPSSQGGGSPPQQGNYKL